MTLDNFEDSFPANRLKNGRSYFKDGKVTTLEQDEVGDWKATVAGTEDYDVEITMKKLKIQETSCSCLSHTEDEHCKHVAAVLYAISDEREEERELEAAKPLPNNIISLLEALRAEDLRIFLKTHLKGNATMIKAFEKSAGYLIAGHGAKDLAEDLTEKIRKFETEDGIPKENIPAILKLAGDYIDTANRHFKKNDLQKALDPLFAITEVLPFEAEFIGDEEGAHHAIVQKAFQLIDDICSKEMPDDPLLQLLIDRAFVGADDPDLPLAHYPVHWLDLIVKHDLAKDDVEYFIAMLDEQITSQAEAGNKAQKERLLRLKIDFMSKKGQAKEALQIAEANPAIANEKEQLLLSAGKKNGDYKAIKQKMLADLEQALANNDKKQYASLQKLIVELMMSKSDVLELRKLAERFYKETGDKLFFEAMKGTYMKADWEQVKGRFD